MQQQPSDPDQTPENRTAGPDGLVDEREAAIRLLRAISRRNDLHGLMREVTVLLREWFGCDAVGIRLREGDDFPYFETRGFPPDFVQAENSLCTRNLEGQLLRDSVGNPVLECMCGNVLCGRFDPSKPFFTERGSFWTNSTTDLLASTSEADRQARTRNRCHGEGYESVALVPLRTAGETFGLLQLNDRRRDRFTPGRIATLEGFSESLAVALAHRKAQDELRRSERNLRNLLGALHEGIWVVDQDAKTTYVNAPMAEMLGYTPDEMLGRHFCTFIEDRAIPDFETNFARRRQGIKDLHDFTLLRKDRTPVETLMQCAPVLDEDGQFVGGIAGVIDVTERKRAERLVIAERDLASRLAAATTLDDILALCLDAALRVTGCDSGGIYLVDPESGSVRLCAHDGFDSGFPPAVAEYGPESLQAEMVRAGKPVYVTGEKLQQPGMEPVRSEGIRFFSVVPVMHMGRPVASVSVASHQAGNIAPFERAALETIAAQMGGAIARARAEEALGFSEQRYRAIVEQQTELVCRFLPDGTPTFVNEAYCRFFGADREAVLQKGFLEMVAEEDRPKALDYLRALARRDGPGTIEHRVIGADGRHRWIQWINQAIRDERGQLVEFQGVGRDATERVEAEQALRESESRFRRIFESSPVGLAIVRKRDQRIVQANPRFCAMLGYTAEEMAGRTVPEITHPDDFEAERCEMAAVASGERPIYTLEKRYVGRGGRVRLGRLTAALLAPQPGSEPMALGIIEDITDERRREQELKEKARLNAILLDSMPCAAMLVEAPGRRVVAANRMAVEMGAQPGMTCYETWMHRRDPCTWCGSEGVIASGRPQHAEVEFAERHWHLAWIPVSETLYLHYAFDITEQRRHEERFRQTQAQLAHVARVSAVGELTAGIAHEVNQPLYSIMNFAKACANIAAQEKPDLETLRQWTKEIVAAATRAGEIVRRLRDFMRRGDGERAAADLNELVGEAVHLISFDARAKGIAVSVAPSDPPATVLADRVQIEQVLLNLLMNACEALSGHPEGQRRVAVAVRPTGRQVEVSVADTGPGLPPGEPDQIFQPFMTTKPGGLGIGLAVSRSIIEAHGGKLQAAGNADGGATFVFQLPLWVEDTDV